VLPLSAPIAVLAGVATVSSRSEFWIEKLVGDAAPQNQPELLRGEQALAQPDDPEFIRPIPSRIRILPQHPESSHQRFRC
jgi:hypothetical protein